MVVSAEVFKGNPPVIKVNKLFLDQSPRITKDSLAVAMLDGRYRLPDTKGNYLVDGIGTTGHKATPARLEYRNGRSRFKLDVFVKPFENPFAAYQEYNNATTALRRGVNTPLMIGVVEFPEDGALLFSKLNHLAEPLSLRRLDYELQDPRVYSPRVFLEQFIGKLADAHNRGMVLGDLHLGNVGFERKEAEGPTPIFFDLETAFVLNDDDLRIKDQGHYRSLDQKGRFIFFETMALRDLGTFVAHLELNGNLPMETYRLLAEALRIYRKDRKESYGLLEEPEIFREYIRGYDETEQKILSSAAAAARLIHNSRKAVPVAND